ncbi:MAG: multiheme c-type cytochrome [Polyangiaceae bacterium]
MPKRLALYVALAHLAVLALVAIGVFVVMPAPKPQAPPPKANNCVTCHASAKDDPGGSHPASQVGCELCHLGEPSAPTKEAAHVGLEREPGALRSAAKTCGRCHARELATVESSLMATGRGIIAVDRWAFGESPTPDGTETIADVLARGAPTAAEDHVRRLCAGCHLGSTRDNRDDAIIGSASGCSACHSPVRASGSASAPSHPRVDGRVDDQRCLGCHSRSGRIALGYQGIYEVAPGRDGPSCADPISLHDGRPGCRAKPDVHHASELACVDCHTHNELMGDGAVHLHEEQATEVRCESCHGPVSAESERTWADVDDPITTDLLRQRGETRDPLEPVRITQRGTPLWNLRKTAELEVDEAARPDTDWTLIGKLDGALHRLPGTPADVTHDRAGHERLSCSSCHDTEAPRCASCHTTYLPESTQWDFGAAREAPGAWHEANDGMSFGPPTLGVNPNGVIVPTMPGMLADLDFTHPSTGRPVKRGLRLHAAIVPHRTQRTARTCDSCHRSSLALGLGSGALDLHGDELVFAPTNPESSDAWTTLFAASPADMTRVRGRSLDRNEQRRVLTVGACLECHVETDQLWVGSAPFTSVLERFLRGELPTCEGRVKNWMRSF